MRRICLCLFLMLLLSACSSTTNTQTSSPGASAACSPTWALLPEATILPTAYLATPTISPETKAPPVVGSPTPENPSSHVTEPPSGIFTKPLSEFLKGPFMSSRHIFDNATLIQWKAVFAPWGDRYHLFVTVNQETDYYVGYYWPGVNFNEHTEVLDAPENALMAISTLHTGEGNWFYIAPKSDDALAVMYHPVLYSMGLVTGAKRDMGEEAYAKEYEEYKEILVIPIRAGIPIVVDEEMIIQRAKGLPIGIG